MKFSIIIPALNEAEGIGNTIAGIRKRSAGDHQILVVDGGSSDGTGAAVQSAGATLLEPGVRGRAAQMNAGAKGARHDLLYFLHADTLPPHQFDRLIERELRAGAGGGCFRLSFDHPHPLLSFYAACTRLDVDLFRFGDQSLFVRRDLFRQSGGFREDHRVMEDQEFVRRFRRSHSFSVIDEPVVTSARKYLAVGVIRLQLTFTVIWIFYQLGLPQRVLVRLYRRWISRKLQAPI